MEDRLVPHGADGCRAARGCHGVAGFVGVDEGCHERLPARVREVGLRRAVFDRCIGGFGPDVPDVVALRAVILGFRLADLWAGRGKTQGYPGDDLDKFELRRHAEDVVHADREVEPTRSVEIGTVLGSEKSATIDL